MAECRGIKIRTDVTCSPVNPSETGRALCPALGSAPETFTLWLPIPPNKQPLACFSTRSPNASHNTVVSLLGKSFPAEK